MKSTFWMLPFTISTVLLMRGKKTHFSMLTSATIGIIINACLPDSYNLTHFTLNEWFKHVFLNNLSTIISIYLLGLLMYIITYSTAIDSVENLFEQHMASPSHFLTAVPILSILMSEDDYLSCLSSGTISGKLAPNFGISKSKTAVIVNITAITACCISPISSWSPVIVGALKNAGVPTKYKFLSVPFNFIILFFTIYVIVLCHNASHESTFLHNRKKVTFNECLEENSTGAKSLCAIIIMLLASYIFFSVFTFVDSPLIWSNIISIPFALHLLYKNDLINAQQLYQAAQKTFREMTSLTFSLLSIWTFVMVCNDYLGFNQFIIECYQRFNVSPLLIPAMIFLLASLFSFLTGSSYGSFNLFTPLAAQLSLNQSSEYQLLAIAGAIGGSLYAVFSYSSDTTALCAQSTDCQINEIRKYQSPLAKHILVWGSIGYVMLATFEINPITYALTMTYITVGFSLSISVQKCKRTWYINNSILPTHSLLQHFPNKHFVPSKLIRLKEYAKHYWKYIVFHQLFLPLRVF